MTNANRMVIVAPGPMSTVRQDQLRDMSAAAEAGGLGVVVAVDTNTPRELEIAGAAIHRLLDRSAEQVASWITRDDRLLALDQPSVLADRLELFHESLDLGEHDRIVMPFADLHDLDSLWPYLLVTGADRPSIVVVLERLLPAGCSDETGGAVGALVVTLRRRLDALGLLTSDRFLLGCRHRRLAELLVAKGVPATPIEDPPPLSPSGATAFVTGDLSPSSAASDPMMRDLIVVPDRLLAMERSAGELDVRAFSELAHLSSTIERLVVDPDLLVDVLSVPETAALHIEIGEPSSTSSTVTAGPAATLDELLTRAANDPTRPVERPFAVHIAPNWGGFGCSHVFEAQLRYLDSAGFEVLTLHVDIDDLAAVRPDDVDRILPSLPAHRSVHRWSIGREAGAIDELALGLIPHHRRPYLSFEGESRVARQAAVPKRLRRAVDRRRVEIVVCNYGYLLPLVDQLGADDAAVICETHDVRAEQHRFQNGLEAVDESDLELEMWAWSRADGVVFINETEEQQFKAFDPAQPTTSAFPRLARRHRVDRIDPFSTKATSLLRAAGRNRRCAPTLITDLIDEATSGHRHRTLFVGSGHDANIESLDWYLEHVHLARLAHDGVELLVAGDIDEAYAGQEFTNVHFLGRVDDLDQVYRASDLVVLPVITGTGFPIKTIDVIDRQMPFVATSRAMGSFAALTDIATFDEPEDFGDEVLRLLRQERCDSTNGPVGSDWTEYCASWDELLASLGRPIVHEVRDPETLVVVRPRRSILHDGRAPRWAVRCLDGAEWTPDGIVVTEPYVRLGVPRPRRVEALEIVASAPDGRVGVEVYTDGRDAGRTVVGPSPTRLIVEVTPSSAGWLVLEALTTAPNGDEVTEPGGLIVHTVQWRTS